MEFTARTTQPLLGLLLSTSALLYGCGGSSTNTSQSAISANIASAVSTFRLEVPAAPTQAETAQATPSFHLAPVVLHEPGNVDAIDNAASARLSPALHTIPSEFRNLSSKRLTLQTLQQARLENSQSPDATATPMSSSAVMTYTPAQIRSAYGLPALPASGATVSATQAAAMGAGQTIYIVDANSDPNAAAELSSFNQHFGLPACTTATIAVNASLPLAAASMTACQFSVVYSTGSGTMTAGAPAYDSGWATEIALDVQWAHATAPLARIVLIEAPDASNNSLQGAVTLANSMGPGAVSMSFGAPEGSWVSALDSTFTAANMTYLAATGDSGSGVGWPSVSPHVLAVGGTSLNYSGTGSRSETAWSDTGGGISAYVAAPSYQTSAIPGLGQQSYRAVADVSFNADPNTGQYLAVMPQGSSSVSWMSAGGTSLATPQWAGIIAVANAQRVLAAKGLLGQVHSMLYGQIATVAGNYSAAFMDVTQGADGSCSYCSARSGYDESTGLGTPNGASMLSQLVGAAASAPVVTPAGIAGSAGVPLTFTVSVNAANPVTYSLSGQPSGLTVSSTGAASWAAPVAGTYAVTVTAKDSKTGLTGSGLYTITISKPVAPVVTAQSISGKAGTPLSLTVAVVAQNPLSYSLSGQPTGMSISSVGVVSWSAPVAGNYSVTVTAKDSKTGLSGSNVFKIAIAAAPPPAVTGATVSGSVGTALSFNVTVSAVNPVTFTISGAPSGMTVNKSGVVSWPTPVAGTYAVTLTAKDSVTGLSGSGVFNVSISANGPHITASGFVGKVGTALTGTVTITDSNVSSLSISVSGVPMGLSFAVNGLTLSAIWSSPVAGNYTMVVTVTDSAGLSTKLNVPITVTN